MTPQLLIYNVLKSKLLKNWHPTTNQDLLLIFMRIPQTFDTFATLTRPAAGTFFLALALLCLSATPPALAQNFSVTTDVDLSKFPGNETDPAVAVSPNLSSNSPNLFVAAVTSATNGLFTSYANSASTVWTYKLIAGSTNGSTNYTTNLVQAYGEPSVAWDINSNLYLAYEPANFQGIAVAFSTNGGQTFIALTNLVPNDVTDQPRIVAGGSTNFGTNIGNVWLVFKDYSRTGTPLVAQGLQTSNITTSVPSPLPGLGSNVTDMIGANSVGFSVLGTNVATITNNQMVIGANSNAPITLTANTLIVTLNGTNLSTTTFNTNAGYVTTIIPATNSFNGTNYIINYTIVTRGTGVFSSPEVIPGSGSGGFADIAIGPSNKVMVAYQNNVFLASTAKVFVNVNTNTLLTNGFGPAITVTSDAVGGFTYIPAESAANGINAGVGLAWDENPASQFYGRAYIVYSAGSSPGINIYSRYSVNNGTSWSSEAQINDDSSGNDHFLPRIAVDANTGSVGLCWYDCRNDTGPGANQIIGPLINNAAMTTNTYTNIFDLDQKSNDDFMVYGTISTNGGTNYVPNLPMIPIWTVSALTSANPGPAGGESFTYVSEASVANNANGVGHHIGLAYASGNFNPVWADNSDFLGDNPPPLGDFQLYTPVNAALQIASLVVSVTEAPYPPTSDEGLNYYVVVTNHGPSTAAKVYVTNVLATNVTLDEVLPAPGVSYTVSSNGQTIVFILGSVSANTSVMNRIIITANQSGYATNIASVSSSTIAPVFGNPATTNLVQEGNGTIGFQTSVSGNLVTNTVLVNGEDLSLGMSASSSNISVGDPVTYTLTVSNAGPSANGLVYITNTLPSNLAGVTNVLQTNVVYLSSNSIVSNGVTPSYSISNNTLVFSLGAIPTNQIDTVTYTATALSLGLKYQYATNSAMVTGTDFDTNLLNNFATNITMLLGEDLGVSLSADASNVNIGDTITYTLTITNYGPADMGVINITNTLSDNLGQVSVVQYPPAGWSGSISQNTIVFNMGELDAGDSLTIIYTAVALSVSATDTNAISTAVVSSTDFDTNTVNNVASTLTTINGEDLAIAVSESPAPVWDGQPITYTETVNNLGLSTTGDIKVTNILSTNLSSINVLQSPDYYSINGNTIVFEADTLDMGQSTTIVFTATPTSIGTASDTVSVGSTDFDPDLSDNSVQVTTTVIVPPPPITNLNVIAYASSAFIIWNTPVPATSQVAYGLTTNYDHITTMSSPGTNQVVLLTGLTRDTNYYFNVMSWENGTLYTTNGSFTNVDTLILQTSDAAYSGSWMEGSPSLSGIYGMYFNDAYTTISAPTASATYTPMIITPGYYAVSAWYPISANFTTNAQMSVSGATNEIMASVNQARNGNSWQPLATNIYFGIGIGGNAVIYNNAGQTNKLVAANAMKWSYVDSQDYPGNNTVPAWWAVTTGDTNYSDYVFGLVPGNPPVTPGLWGGFDASNNVTVTFTPYQGGRKYQLQITTNLSTPNWLTLTNQPAVATDGTGNGVFTISPSSAGQFYFRLSAQLSTNY